MSELAGVPPTQAATGAATGAAMGAATGSAAGVDVPGEPGDVATAPAVDLDAVGRRLEGVERALERLDDGTYWTDEVTGEPIPDDVLATDPITRRAP